jgi:hypothetical protein
MPTGIYDRTKSKLNMGEFGRRPPWNKGLTGVYSDEYRRKISKGSKGNRSAWKGGRYTAKGYIFVYCPTHPYITNGGYVREHRLVIEAIIGRYLLRHEPVHHLGKKNDNNPQMLMAFISYGPHNRFEHGIEPKPEEVIFDGRKIR